MLQALRRGLRPVPLHTHSLFTVRLVGQVKGPPSCPRTSCLPTADEPPIPPSLAKSKVVCYALVHRVCLMQTSGWPARPEQPTWSTPTCFAPSSQQRVSRVFTPRDSIRRQAKLDVQATVDFMQESCRGQANSGNGIGGHTREITSDKRHGQGNTMSVALVIEAHAGGLESRAIQEHVIRTLFDDRGERLA